MYCVWIATAAARPRPVDPGLTASQEDARMAMIEIRPLPRQALLARYAGDGAYTDCFAAELDGSIDCAHYVEAFYILRLAIAAPSTDAQAHQVASGAIDRFAAWHVEDRAPDQLLMCDIHGSTRSWFMVEAMNDGAARRTRLYFGSAVVSAAMRRPTFRLLIGLHVLYSKALLLSARRRLANKINGPGA
jgi:hypothetical protein